MKIWLDDIRDAPDETWRVCRDAQSALSLLTFMCVQEMPVETISLDHDLGVHRSGVENHSGYDLLKWLEEYAAEGDWGMIPLSFQIHSANPVGRKNMQAAIDSIERMRNAS